MGISKQILILPMIGHVIFHAVLLYFKVQVQKGGLYRQKAIIEHSNHSFLIQITTLKNCPRTSC